MIAWLTGLPGAGKTTIAEVVAARLQRLGVPVAVLDGDVVRAAHGHDLGFSAADRDRNVRREGAVRLYRRHGFRVDADDGVTLRMIR